MSRFRSIAEIDQTADPFSGPALDSADDTNTAGRFVRPPFLAGAALEQFIAMRDALIKAGREREVRAVGVTSAREQEGKTTVAIGLALTLAVDTQKRVLLLDGNMRAPAVHRFFQIPRGPGLTDLLREPMDYRKAVVRMEEYPLCLLPAGAPYDAPSELLTLGRFSSVMGQLKKAFDTIVVDCPSAMQHADVELTGGQLDGVVLVIETDKTQLSLLQAAKAKLEGNHLQILGVAMNRFGVGVPKFLNRRLGLE